MKTKAIIWVVFATFISCNFGNKSKQNIDIKSKKSIELLNQKESGIQNKTDNDFGELITTIQIEVKANQEQLKDFQDGIVPWISIENPEKEIEKLIDSEKIVVENTEITLNIDYPLNNPASFILKSSQNSFTKKQLVLEISKKYHEIYNEEENSAKQKTIPVDKREGLINRNETDGKYGIWGHDIGDLDLSSIEIYKTKDGKIQIVLVIES
jgi:hypothetical protein